MYSFLKKLDFVREKVSERTCLLYGKEKDISKMEAKQEKKSPRGILRKLKQIKEMTSKLEKVFSCDLRQ